MKAKSNGGGSFDAVLAKAVEMLDFGAGSTTVAPLVSPPGAAAAHRSKGKGTGGGVKSSRKKKKKGGGSQFKSLPKETLTAIEMTLGMCWDPTALALVIPNLFDMESLRGHDVPDKWYDHAGLA